MQDLTTIRGDGAPAPSGPPPAGSGRAGKHGQPKMSRSASESAGSSGMCHSPSPPSTSPASLPRRGPVHCVPVTGPWPRGLPPAQSSSDHAGPATGRASLRPGQGAGLWTLTRGRCRSPAPHAIGDWGGWVTVLGPNLKAAGAAGRAQAALSALLLSDLPPRRAPEGPSHLPRTEGSLVPFTCMITSCPFCSGVSVLGRLGLYGNHASASGCQTRGTRLPVLGLTWGPGSWAHLQRF